MERCNTEPSNALMFVWASVVTFLPSLYELTESKAGTMVDNGEA